MRTNGDRSFGCDLVFEGFHAKGPFGNLVHMSDYRRNYVEGGTYFFTLKSENNAPVFRDDAVTLLGTVFRETQEKWPFLVPAMVLLPDHLHAIWTLPTGDDKYSLRLAWLKKEFTKRYLQAGGTEQPTSLSRQHNRRRGVWQRHFWEHTIKDENDFQRHFDYIHWNPVKHGYVKCPADWPHSSFHRWVAQGVYPPNWGCSGREPPSIKGLTDVGE